MREDTTRAGNGRRDTTLAVWWLLAAVALAVAVPLSVMAVLTVRQLVSDAHLRSTEEVRAIARQVANRLDDLVREHHGVLTVVAHTIRRDAGTMVERDSLLAAISRDLPPYIQNLSIYSTEGVNLGHTFPYGTAPRAVVGDRRYFTEALRTKRLAIGDPIVSRLSGRRVAGIVLPVLGADSSVTNVVAASIELDHLLELLTLPQLPERSVVTVLDTSGVIVARTAEPEWWIGRNVREHPSVQQMLARSSGEDELPSLDGVTRYVSFVRVTSAPWIVSVGVPPEVVHGQASERTIQGVVIGLLSLLGGLVLAAFFARRIGVPVGRLTEDAIALGHGDATRRADAHAAGPMRPLALAFNRMADELDQRARDSEASRRAVLESEAQYRLLSEGIPILIADVGDDGRIAYVNQAFVDFNGRERAALVGTPLVDVFPTAMRADIASRARAAMAGTTTVFDTVLDRADGGAAHCLVTFVPRRSAEPGAPGTNGSRSGLLVLISDVTQRVELESQLRHVQKMEAVGQLAGGVAHDFNNLLTVILSHVSFARSELAEPTSPDGVAESLGEIHAAGTRAAELTRQLLTFARRQQLTPQVLDLNAITAGIDRLLRRVLGEHIELVTVTSPELWQTEADPTQVEQILINLAVNARDAMPQGGRLTIETANATLGRQYAESHPDVGPGDYVMVAVTDTGTGITPEDLGRIFEPFFTTKPLGAGTGLGLAVCYGIAKQHGGHIAAYSEVGHGSTFRLYLPRTHRRPEDDVGGASLPATRGTETILLVEDTESVRVIAERALNDRGYHVLTAVDGVEGQRVAAAHDAPIDLLLTDMVMPRVGGRDLAAALRRARPAIKVLYTSGYTAHSTVSREGIDPNEPFLAKPYVPETLLAKVREVLDGPVKDRRA
jgi:PAS domain S-box-containing protein